MILSLFLTFRKYRSNISSDLMLVMALIPKLAKCCPSTDDSCVFWRVLDRLSVDLDKQCGTKI